MNRTMRVKRMYSVILFLLLPTRSLLLSTRHGSSINLSIFFDDEYTATISEAEKGKLTSSSSPLLPLTSSSVIPARSHHSHVGKSREKISSAYLSSALSTYYLDPSPPSQMTASQKRRRGRSHVHPLTNDTGLSDRSPAAINSSSLSPPDSTVDQNTTTSNYAETENSNIHNELYGKCRHREYLPPDLYELDTCAHCYKYIRNISSSFELYKKLHLVDLKLRRGWSVYTVGVLVQDRRRIDEWVYANISDPDERILASFANPEAKNKWLDCCKAAVSCCKTMLQSSYVNSSVDAMEKEKFCPPTWDGWQCWSEATPAGEEAEAFCPHYIFSITEPPSCTLTKVSKLCNANGAWFAHRTREGWLKEWSNYSQCTNVNLQKNRAYVHMAAYYISIIAIIPALAIFFAYKQLRVHRIILHQNLFISMLINGILVIVFKTTVMLNDLNSATDGSVSIIHENGIACRLLFILTKYSRMTNYMWMFCEGFYLHKLIAAAFAEQKSLLVFYLIGWVFPIIPTAFYAGFRIYAANDRCWVVPQESWEWALNGPSLLSLLINVLFLINIIRVLVTKLRAAHAQEPSQYRKAVRATLVLLPLFGVHFIVTIYRPPSSTGACFWTELYFYINDILDGLQGFLVALIFCYFNGEVSSLLKRTWTRWREQHTSGSMCNRRQASANLRARNSRGGSLLGRSVISTHIYSSVPPSPEPNTTTSNVIVPNCGGTPRVQISESNSNSSLKNRQCNNSLNANSAATVNGKSVSVNLYVVTNDTGTGNVMSETRLVHSGDSLELRDLEGKNQSPKISISRNGQSNEHQL